MPRKPQYPKDAWPWVMDAETAAAFFGERSVEAFLRRCGTLYPRGRKIAGRRGLVWVRTELEAALAKALARISHPAI